MNTQAVQANKAAGDVFFQRFFDTLVTPVLQLIIMVAFVYFLFGVFRFIIAQQNGEQDEIAKGKRHLVYGSIGLFISFSLSAVSYFIELISNSVNGL